MNCIQVDFAVDDHGHKVMGFLLVQQNVNRNMASCGIQEVSKNVNICKHVHHYGNNLDKKDKRKNFIRLRSTTANYYKGEVSLPKYLIWFNIKLLKIIFP